VASTKKVTVNGVFQVGKDLDDFFGSGKLTGGGTIEAKKVIVEGDFSEESSASVLEVSGAAVKTKS